MDKRNLLFIFLFSLALLGVNIGFSYWSAEQKRDYLEKKAAYEAYIEKQNSKRIFEKTAKVNDLDFIQVTPEAVALKSGGAITLFGAKAAPKSIKGLSLACFEEYSEPCALYFDILNASNLDFLGASKAFIQNSSSSQSGSLLVYDNEIITIYPATINLQNVIGSPLTKNQGGFNPSEIKSGLVLIEYDNEFIPVALAEGDGTILTAIPFARFDTLETLIGKTPALTPSQIAKSERLVLENEYLQLVISTKGGSIAEINLPFAKEGSPSVVAEVENERILENQSPKNVQFPLMEAEKALADGSRVKITPTQSGYYPLLRRTILDKDGEVRSELPSSFYALSLVGEFPEVSLLNYRVVEFTPTKLVLEARQPHRKVQRVYELPKDSSKEPYIFNFELKVDGDKKGLKLSSGLPEADMGNASPAPVLKYRRSHGSSSDIENIDPPKESSSLQSLNPDWVANGNAFFVSVFDPQESKFEGLRVEAVAGEKVPSRLTLIDEEWNRYKASSLPAYQMLMPLSQAKESLKLRVFAGPLSEPILKKLDATYSDRQSNYDPNYRSLISFTGWFSFILRPFASAMMALMNLFHAITGSWAAAIVLLTICLRAMLYPLNAWSNRSMRMMQQISPKIKLLQEKYKNDPKKLQMETVALYKEHKVNPASGCLPILIQIPFLFAMLHLFKTNFSLRGASFIPIWIDDLASPDVLFSWGYPLPIIGSDFHLLPILLGAVMYYQSQMSIPAEGELTEAQRQQKAMGNIMTIAFTFMFYNLPSGLNIYWLASSLLGLLQQKYNQRQKLKMEKPEIIIKKSKK